MVMEVLVRNHLRNLNLLKSMRPDEMHPTILRDLADGVAKTLSMISEKSCQSGEIPGDWRKGNIVPIFKKGLEGGPWELPSRQSWKERHGAVGEGPEEGDKDDPSAGVPAL